MEESKYTLSYINETPGLVVRGDSAKEVDDLIREILPVFKKFKDATDKGKQARMTQQQEMATVTGEAPICPIHGTQAVWKTGNSKKTGKPYAFWSCPTRNADGSFCVSKFS